VYDPVSDEIIHGATIETDVLAEVMAAMRRELPDVSFAVEIDHGRTLLTEKSYPSLRNDVGRRFATHDELVASGAVKLLARLPEGTPEEFLASSAKLLDGTVQVTSSSRQ